MGSFSAKALAAGAVLVLCAALPVAASDSGKPDLKTLVSRFASAMHYSKKVPIKTVMITANGFMENRVVTYTIMRKAPDKFLETIKIDGTSIKEQVGYDGSTAWVQLPDGRVGALEGDAKRRVAGVASGLGGDSSTMGLSAGPEASVEGTRYYVLRFRDDRGNGRDVLLDEKSYLPIYGRLVFGSQTRLFAVGPLDTGPSGEYYPREQQMVNVDGSLGNPATVTSIDDNIPLADSMFAPPGQ